MFTTFLDVSTFFIEPSSMDFRRVQSSPRSRHILWIFPLKLSYHTGGALTGFLQKSDDIQPLHQTEWPGLQMVLRSAFHQVFSPCSFFHSTHCSFSNTIRLRSRWCRSSTFHPNFLPEVLVRQFAFCKEPLVHLQTSQFWSFWGSECKYTVPPGCQFRRMFRIWVMRKLCGCWHFCNCKDNTSKHTFSRCEICTM